MATATGRPEAQAIIGFTTSPFPSGAPLDGGGPTVPVLSARARRIGGGGVSPAS
jgi:hypothetical protein